MRPIDSETAKQRPPESVTCSKEDLRQKKAPIPAGGVATALPPAALVAAAAQPPPEVGIYMDGHLAGHLVQYTQLLQRMFMAKSKKMSGK